MRNESSGAGGEKYGKAPDRTTQAFESSDLVFIEPFEELSLTRLECEIDSCSAHGIR